MDRQSARTPMCGLKSAAMILCAATLLSDGAQASKVSGDMDLQNLKSWGYQLQRLDVQQAVRMSHDILVVDYSKDGSESGALTWSEISQLKKKPDGSRRIILAYMSIGEAENYRYYWKPDWKNVPPKWLAKENKQWPGNFLVKYWMSQWQKIILGDDAGYLSRIISAGFDGVYLDRIDAYADWAGSHGNSRNQMINFVVKLSRTAKSKKDNFLIFAQNAEELLANPHYISHIDGIAKEDMLFGASSRSKSNSKTLRNSHIKYLKIARSNKKPVLVVEYLSPGLTSPDEVVNDIRELNFIPYISERKLDVLFPPPK